MLMCVSRATFIIFTSACAAAFIWATHFVPETANVALEEVDALFQSNAGREDRVLKEEVRYFRAREYRVDALLLITCGGRWG